MRHAQRNDRRPLRALHVIQSLTGGGAESVLCSLVTSFDRRVVDCALMSVYPTETPERLSTMPIFRAERRGRYDIGFFGRMIGMMRSFKPDIVHAHLHNGKIWGRLAALVARVPIVVFTEHSPLGDPRMPGEKFFDAAVDRLTDGTIAFTEYQRNLLVQSDHVPVEKISVIQNGITLPLPPSPERRLDARRRLGASDDEFAVLAVGRLVPIKNKRLALEAMKCLSPAARERIRMYIIGDGEEEEVLRTLAVSEGVADVVRFMGHRDDAIDLLYGGDLFYMPSHVEGMPLAALEAFSVGLPVLSTPWPGVSDLLHNGEFGTILSDWAPQTSAVALERAMTSRQLAEMAARAQEFARMHYAIEHVARLHETLYVDLAERKGVFSKQCREPVAQN